MSALYRRTVSKGGRVRYVRVYEWDQGDPAEGLWVVRKERSAVSHRWLRRYLGPIPAVPPEAAWIASRIDVIADALVAVRDLRASAMDVARVVVNALIDAAALDDSASYGDVKEELLGRLPQQSAVPQKRDATP